MEDKVIYEENEKPRYWGMTSVKNETKEGEREGE